jgi:hypothetical protein
MRAPMPPHKVIPLDPMLGAASRPESANVRTQRLRPGVTCVGWTRQGPLCAEGSGPQVLVNVERPQRSEDERR